MRRSPAVITLVLAALSLLFGGCSPGGAIADDPSPSPSPLGRAPQAFILHAGQLPGYKHAGDIVVTPAMLADQDRDPTIAAQLAKNGFQRGARATYNDPGTVSPTVSFATVFSQVIIFDAPSGAQTFFGQELKRRQGGGATVPLTGFSANGTDQSAFLATSAPASGTTVAENAYFVLLRRGRMAATLFANGSTAVATPDSLRPLVADQIGLLRQPLDD